MLFDDGGPIIFLTSFLLLLLTSILSSLVSINLNPWRFETLFIEQLSVKKNKIRPDINERKELLKKYISMLNNIEKKLDDNKFKSLDRDVSKLSKIYTKLQNYLERIFLICQMKKLWIILRRTENQKLN